MTLLSAGQVLNAAADLTVTAVDGQYLHITERGTHTRSYVNLPAVDQPQSVETGYTQLVESRRDVWIPQDYTQAWLERRDLTGEPVWRGLCGDFFPKAKPVKVCGDPTDWDSPAFYQELPPDARAAARVAA